MQLLEKTQAETNTKAIDTKQACRIARFQLILSKPSSGPAISVYIRVRPRFFDQVGHETMYVHSVAKVYAVLPFYDVKCLCSGGRE